MDGEPRLWHGAGGSTLQCMDTTDFLPLVGECNLSQRIMATRCMKHAQVVWLCVSYPDGLKAHAIATDCYYLGALDAGLLFRDTHHVVQKRETRDLYYVLCLSFMY